MPGNNRGAHVFCVEGSWEADLRLNLSMRAVLDLLSSHSRVRYVYRTCLTKGELLRCVDKWVQKRYESYRILYLGFHGQPGEILTDEGAVTLDELAERLGGRARNRVIYFGSCESLRMDRRHLDRFLKTSGALAVCGFEKNVGWLKSAAFDVLLLDAFQGRHFSGRGMRNFEKYVRSTTGRLTRELGFRLVYLPY